MLSRRLVLLGAAAGAAIPGIFTGSRAQAAGFPLTLTDVQWRSRLTAPQYAVLRKADTEVPFTSPLLNEHREGTFACAGCDQALFSSRTKFDSGTGWPSFYAVLPHAVVTRDDRSIGMDRTEVLCGRCGGHLGHVFNDGPRPTGLRYCMNGLALTFHPGKA